MRKFLIIFIFIISFPIFASAHVVRDDGAISVLFHTNPGDDPIIAQPAALLFLVSDSNNKFDPKVCDCKVSVSLEGKNLLASPLYLLNPGSANFWYTVPFTFPQKAIYNIEVKGKPKTAGAFQDFKVRYDLRVDREQGAVDNPAKSNLPIIIGVFIISAIAIFITLKIINKNNNAA